MSFSTRLSVVFVLLFTFIFTFAYAATFEIRNECPYTVWAASTPIGGGRRLDRGQTWTINVNPGTETGRIWGRTNCNFDGSGRGSCQTGDCGGLLQCQGWGKPPNTITEYSLNQAIKADFFDISIVDGFNIPIEFSPTRPPADKCLPTRCTADIEGTCPAKLRAPGGCSNPCTVFKTPKYCCTVGPCGPTEYSRYFNDKCPDAYSYPKDDRGDPGTTFTCPGGTNYTVVFCPNGDHYNDSCAYNQTLCVRPTPPQCTRVDDDFVRKKGYMDGKPYQNEGDPNITIEECQHKCGTNCSCIAYASVHDNGTGCQLWNRGIEFTEVRGGSTYIHMLATLRSTGIKWWIWCIIGIAAAVVIILIIASCYLIWRKLRQRGEEARQRRRLLLELGANTTADKFMNTNETGNADKKGPDVKIFSFSSILAATNNFSPENKLGQGGFGPVYKGMLLNGQEIAVKRLSNSSGQGLVEFKNEIVLIAKLQHMNLVRLLGCCIKGEEKMLIYEYMPNKSLDFFLFDPVRKELLDWKRRLSIIEGIAQGLLYLHKYSRLRVIHRDLKAGNVLLDNDMNPKISDFGLARIFEQNESQANTNRPVGTHGYMSPEYIMEGIFSMKSDVFSFGVLLLEIVSGRKNSSFYHFERPTNLIGYTWELWREGKTSELLDPSLDASCQQNEPLRLIHIGLLCVQEYASDRPSMSDVVCMLTTVTIPLAPPKQPAFFAGRSMTQADTANRKTEKCSINGVSLSTMDGR